MIERIRSLWLRRLVLVFFAPVWLFVLAVLQPLAALEDYFREEFGDEMRDCLDILRRAWRG